MLLKENELTNPKDIISYIGKSKSRGTNKKSTDKRKILAVLEYLQIPYEEKYGNSIEFSNRRFYFDTKTEEISKITDLKK